MKLKFYTLDVFTHRKFGGNPLAVVLDADELATEHMQAITREFNLSETTFVMKPSNPAHTAKVRIFFPGGEMPFAGHPTIGTAALLAELAHGPEKTFETEIKLELKAGLTPVHVVKRAGRIEATLTAPVVPFHVQADLPSVTDVASALNLDPDDIGFDDHGIALLEGGPRFFYVPVKTREALQKSMCIEPHWSRLIKPLDAVDAAYIYTRGGANTRTAFRARMYAPGGGIPEDPATGSATALLAAQIHKAESLVDGTHTWHLEQGYEMGRPSELRLEADISGSRVASVRVGGSAVRMMEGVLNL
jgi:trans-2,3-dihydro-3-hydroxyanthranilate isomerase